MTSRPATARGAPMAGGAEGRTRTGAAQPRLAGAPGLGFDAAVPANAYRWWYLDAFSADGHHGLTVIAFIGSVFSPYYAAARRRGPAPAEQFCSVNAILYGRGGKRWAMTERGAAALERTADRLRIGPSCIEWDDRRLVIDIDEITFPIPGRLRGRIEVSWPTLQADCYALDQAGQHRWWPAAPAAQVRVTMGRPDLAWQGAGYLDSNAGVVPLEDTFGGWHWSRASHADGSSSVLYDTEPLDGAGQTLALRFSPDGTVRSVPPPAGTALPGTSIWRIRRHTRATPGCTPRVLETLEDTPFYARSKLAMSLDGERVDAMHESLDLTRFRRRWVQALLPFRMPRRTSV